jgi:hypothetical protein
MKRIARHLHYRLNEPEKKNIIKKPQKQELQQPKRSKRKREADDRVVSTNSEIIDAKGLNANVTYRDKPLQGPVPISLADAGTFYDTYINNDGTPKLLCMPHGFEQVFKVMISNSSQVELGMHTTSPHVVIDTNDPNANEKYQVFTSLVARFDQTKFKIKSGKSVPSKYSLSQYIAGVYNQGNVGSCYANAISQLINIARAVSLKKKLSKSRDLENVDMSTILNIIWSKRPSRQFIEYVCDRLQTECTGDTVFDQGAYDWSAMQAIKEFGACSELIYSYPLANVISLEQFKKLPEGAQTEIMIEFCHKQLYPPDSYCFAKAKYEKDMKSLHWSCLSNPTLSPFPNDRVPFGELKSLIKAYIACDIPLYLGIPVYASWYNLPNTRNTNVPLNTSDDPLIGYHAVVIVGYDGDNVQIVNSWGPKSGNGGVFNMPWEYIEKNQQDSVVMLLVSDEWEQSKYLQQVQ